MPSASPDADNGFPHDAARLGLAQVPQRRPGPSMAATVVAFGPRAGREALESADDLCQGESGRPGFAALVEDRREGALERSQRNRSRAISPNSGAVAP